MSEVEHNQTENTQDDRKKISLQDAIRQRLASKQQAQAAGKGFGKPQASQVMRSQQTKKANNQRRRTGV